MSEPLPTSMGPDLNGNGGDSSVQADPALHQRLRAVTKDFSHRELAELTGVSLETSRRYSEGRGPSVAYLKRLCDAVGISADWLLLGRGSPVYRPGIPTTRFDSSVDEVLEGLSRYLKRLHQELARAAIEMQAGVEEEDAAKAARTEGALVLPAEVEIPLGEFTDPFAEQSHVLGPEEAAAVKGPAPAIQVRLVLGPANGVQLRLPSDGRAEILVRVDSPGEAQLLNDEDPWVGECQRYRRVFDRVYRWVGPSRRP